MCQVSLWSKVDTDERGAVTGGGGLCRTDGSGGGGGGRVHAWNGQVLLDLHQGLHLGGVRVGGEAGVAPVVVPQGVVLDEVRRHLLWS